jgi:hypothetical protein
MEEAMRYLVDRNANPQTSNKESIMKRYWLFGLTLIALLLSGCGPPYVGYNKGWKTIACAVSESTEKIELEIGCQPVPNIPTARCISLHQPLSEGINDITFFAKDVFYEDASNNIIAPVDSFVIWTGSEYIDIKSVTVLALHLDHIIINFVPPATAQTVVFKDATHEKILFRVGLK